MIRTIALSVAAIAAVTSPAAAAADRNARAALDPNEKVCEKVEVIGSRLAVKRVCATRAEWAEKRRADRDYVEQTQRRQCAKGAEGCP